MEVSGRAHPGACKIVLWELPFVPDQYGLFPHYLELGPFTSDFIFLPVLGPCLWDDEELSCSGEVVDVVKGEVMEFSRVVLQIQVNYT